MKGSLRVADLFSCTSSHDPVATESDSRAHRQHALCLQAHAWAALGKLGLADEPLAKKCIHLFVQQLEHATSPAVCAAKMLSHWHA